MSLDDLAVWLRAHDVRCEVDRVVGQWRCTLRSNARYVSRIADTLSYAVVLAIGEYEAVWGTR